MTSVRSAIWLRPADAPAPAPVVPPRLTGPEAALSRVMAALSHLRDPSSGIDIVAAGRVVALDIGADEATLTLRLGAGHCDHAHHVAEEAFDVLRLQLPGLDLYLHHELAAGCTDA